MSKLFDFQEQEKCTYCEMMEDYLDAALESEGIDDLRNVLNSLYDEGVRQGKVNATILDLEHKSSLLNLLETNYDECE